MSIQMNDAIGITREHRREYHKKWQVNNRKKTREASRKWRANNPGYGKKWRIDNAEYWKEWQTNNREKFLEYQNKWYAKNTEKMREYYKKRRTNYREKVLRYERNSKVIRYFGSLERYEKAMFKYDGECAFACDKRAELVHHIDGKNIRNSPKGNVDNSLKNLLPLCRSCHMWLHGHKKHKGE